jgi:hypothetical protein
VCYFLTVGIPANARDVVTLFGEAGLTARENTNPGIQALFPQGTAAFWVTTIQCSCDLDPRPRKRFNEAAARARYAKRGWSKTKIDRAIEAKRPALPPKVRKLHDALTKMVDVVGTVHLYGRVYHGDQDREQVSPTGRVETTLSAFLHDEGRFAEDVVLALRAG